MPALAEWLIDVSKSAYGWPASLRWTYDTSRRLTDEGIAGDFVECGVGNGVHPAAMARACSDAGVRRDIRLFDSFAGLPHGGPADGDWNKHWGDGSGRLEPTGVAVASLQSVQSNLERWGCDVSMFSFFVGWFERTLPAVSGAWRARYEAGEAEGIAFLRVDGDLYSSTLACLAYLEPLVVPGGIVCIDDLNLDGCMKACDEYFIGTGRGLIEWTEITESGDGFWVKS